MCDGGPLDLGFKQETGDLYMVDAYLDSMTVGRIDFMLDFPFKSPKWAIDLGRQLTPIILYQLYFNKIEKENNLDS